ncbi:hypothetical protein BGZ95_011775 [Linnemannia exigua]|uniref:Major facilitator superfamily (MFS) profile domain-containing protein n=1 Tax=Linnemannia exigua TaxID=604196 RepID=A0AAD4DJM5_9FUNG|nr:hypothetical protein BGZ95_011775 [Linnemannia exigua]
MATTTTTPPSSASHNATSGNLDEKISINTLAPEATTASFDTTGDSLKVSKEEYAKDPEAGKTEYYGTSTTDVLPPTFLTFPDGGFGWLVVFGAFMMQFCCFGFNFSWGVYQEHYVNENIFPGNGLTEISWAGTIGAGSVFITGPFQSRMAILPALTVPVQWFDKRRGFALGISVAGSGIGGAALAPLNRYLISRVGYEWALRIMAIMFIVVVFSILPCIRTRVPPIKKGGPLFDIALFKDRGFTTMYLMGVLVTFGYLTPVYLLPSYAVKYGMDKATGATLVGIYSGVNAVSRILLGIAADRYGRFNVLFTCTFLGGLSCLVFWLNAKTLGMCIVFVIFYGINGGGFVSLFPAVAAEVVGVEKLAAAVGMLYSGNLFGK